MILEKNVVVQKTFWKKVWWVSRNEFQSEKHTRDLIQGAHCKNCHVQRPTSELWSGKLGARHQQCAPRGSLEQLPLVTGMLECDIHRMPCRKSAHLDNAAKLSEAAQCGRETPPLPYFCVPLCESIRNSAAKGTESPVFGFLIFAVTSRMGMEGTGIN